MRKCTCISPVVGDGLARKNNSAGNNEKAASPPLLPLKASDGSLNKIGTLISSVFRVWRVPFLTLVGMVQFCVRVMFACGWVARVIITPTAPSPASPEGLYAIRIPPCLLMRVLYSFGAGAWQCISAQTRYLYPKAMNIYGRMFACLDSSKAECLKPKGKWKHSGTQLSVLENWM
ncbi:unnamed protein product [Rangifer tarandus platyrhynchus]|uniref:Uncharacterized protein n=2 Tax=Rangifer tarandus platyrhynchus TaxID=3082113 RepID=A0AC59ZH48_RANTA|nr:unnamed protein product [Rangifer tarandus platyrhynchus]